MARDDSAEAGVRLVAAKFPEDAERLQRLSAADARFRELCEEYGLARESLAVFEAMPDAADRPEVPDYRAVIAELEGEIGRYLGGTPPGR